MSQLDDELEQAVRDGESRDAEQTPPAVSDASEEESDSRRRGWGLLAGLLVIGGGILTLVLTASEEAVVYAYDVAQLQEKAADLGERQVRVTGQLVSGTLVRRAEPCEFRFKMETDKSQLPVRYPHCIVPDTFRDVKGQPVEVTAEGRLDPAGHLNATKIFAKCPSKYEGEGAPEVAGMQQQVDHKGLGPKPEFIAPRVEGIN